MFNWSKVFQKIEFFSILVLSCSAVLSAEEKKPNFIFILCDDVGYGDPGCYDGGESRGCPTPNLDRMAAEGMILTNYYGQASCTAGRAAFMTGRQPIRTGLSPLLVPHDQNGLHKDEPTIAEALKKLGYKTAMWGKWHLGDKFEFFPTEHGFDQMRYMLPYYAGIYTYSDLTLQPDFPIHNAHFVEEWNRLNFSQWEGEAGSTPRVVVKRFNYEDLATADDKIADDVVDYIQKHAKDPEPFFLYVCFNKVHNPTNPSPRFKGKSIGGGSYLDSLMELDDNSGRILQALRDAKIAENTLVIWTSDNGAWVDAWPDAGYTPFRGEKGTCFEGGFRCPAIVWWPNHVPAGSKGNGMMSHMDWWPTFVTLAGSTPPSHLTKDNRGKEIIFDGIDNSTFILGKSESKRDQYVFINDLQFGGIRVTNFKALFTAKDTWLGSEIRLGFPAIYNLWWDPGECYDILFNGAGPTRGNFRTSPGRSSGQDHAWVIGLVGHRTVAFLKEMVKYPNRTYIPNVGTLSLLVDSMDQPTQLRDYFLLMEPSSQTKR